MSNVTATEPAPLQEAFSAFKGGDMAGTEKLCQEFLEKHDRTNPFYFDAIQLLAAFLLRARRPADALASYDAALAIRPHDANALNNRGLALKTLGRLDEAVASYDSALAVQPDFAEALINRGNALVLTKRFEEALASYDKALAIRLDNATLLNNHGTILNALGRFDEAVASYDKALAIRPDFVEALNNRGVALTSLRRFEDVLANCKQSLAAHPGNVQALATQGIVLCELGRFEDAVASYDEALATQSQNAELRYSRARALTELGRAADALIDCDAALARRNDYAEAHNQRGLVLTEVRHIPEALASFRKAQELRPDFTDPHRNELKLHLLTGDFRRAWWKDDQQWKWDASAAQPNKARERQWDGLQLLSNKTILLHDAQSHTDAIQFCRYIPRLAARGARVIIDVDQPLRELIGGMPGVAQVTSGNEAATEFDLHCPFASLPRAFATTLETIPNAVPYLPVAPHAADQWNDRLGAKERLRIGIVWSGEEPQKHSVCSIELAVFLKLLNVNATFVCAQRRISGTDAELLRERPEILTFGDALNDFSEAAACISRLDLLLSVDSSLAHIAGALGKPVWVLLRHTPDWCWLIDREDSPWYPTARLFRQSPNGDWSEVVDRVAVALQKFIETNDASPPLAPELLMETQLRQRVT
jgi:tetratricopeptide (TPR) repeat protein